MRGMPFPVHPFDYLLKPVDKARLEQVLGRGRDVRVERRERMLLAQGGAADGGGQRL